MEPLVLGWFEPVSLPELGVELCYARVDSGADYSTLHARDVVRVGSGHQVEFTPPLLRRQDTVIEWPSGGVRRVRAPCIDERLIRSSSGHEALRYVILTELCLGQLRAEVELTLTHREGMRFPMLLGRKSLLGLPRPVLIDPSRERLTEAELLAQAAPEQAFLAPPP